MTRLIAQLTLTTNVDGISILLMPLRLLIISVDGMSCWKGVVVVENFDR